MLKQKKRRRRPIPLFTPRFTQPTGTPIDNSSDTINIRPKVPLQTIIETPEYVPAPNPASNPRGLDVKRPKHKPSVRSVALTKNMPKYKGLNYSSPDIEARIMRAEDPTDINVKKDAKAFGKFKPEFIHRLSDSGLGDMERSLDEGDSGYFGVNFVQDPTTTTGDEYIFQDIDGSGKLRHPAMRTMPMDKYEDFKPELGEYGGNTGYMGDTHYGIPRKAVKQQPVFGGDSGPPTKLHYIKGTSKPTGRAQQRDYTGVRSYALDEDSIVGQTIDRGNDPQSKPRSWEGTKSGGYSRKEAFKKATPMTLERRLRKANAGTIGKTAEEMLGHEPAPQKKRTEVKPREFPNVPILKSVNYVAGHMKYGDFLGREDVEKRREEVAKMKIANRGSRGCDADGNNCSEFYLLKDREIYKPTEMTLGKVGNRIQVEGGIGTYQSAPAYDSDDDAPTPKTTYTDDITRVVDPITIAQFEGRKGANIDTFFHPHNVKYAKGEHMPRTDVKQPLAGVLKPSEIDYGIGLPMISTKQTGRIQSKGDTQELDITKAYGGVKSGVNELGITEGMKYKFDKTEHRKGRKEQRLGMKPIDKLKDKDLVRLAKSRGIPTTSREKKQVKLKAELFTDAKARSYFEGYAPAQLSREQLLRKLRSGLPTDMSYNKLSGATPTTMSEVVASMAVEDENRKGFTDLGELVSDGESDFDEEPMGDMSNYMY